MLNGSHQEVRVNFLRFTETDLRSKEVLFEADWITDFELAKHTVAKIASP